jgi:tetrapyrrole methylase family protein / MazG family protein
MDRFDAAGRAFADLCRTMSFLRSHKGCAWDREQTLESLEPYLLEESHELLEAMRSQDSQAHCEELGDVLFQTVFQGQIAFEQGDFDITEVVQQIDAKLHRRHPDLLNPLGSSPCAENSNADASAHLWEERKASEKPERESILDGIPKTLPALLRAQRTGEKAALYNFDWPGVEGVIDKVKEEWQEFHDAYTSSKSATDRLAEMEAELGDLFLALTSLCRHLKLDAESSLRKASDRFSDRFRRIEKEIRQLKNTPADTRLDLMNHLWETSKKADL